MINVCFAYNKVRCDKYLERYNFNATDIMISSTKSTSSYGECSLVGDRTKEIEQYFFINYNLIKIDTSRGNGEFIKGFTELLSCNEEARGRLTKFMRTNFGLIFTIDDEKINDSKLLYTSFQNKLAIDRREILSCIF